MKLLKTQQNDILEELVASGFDPAEFEWQKRQGPGYFDGEVSVLVHRPSGFHHMFIVDAGGYIKGIYTPGKNQESGSSAAKAQWNLYRAMFREWLVYLRRELEAPSVWDEVARQIASRPFLGSMGPGGNSRFEPQEVEALRAEIDALRGRVDAVCKLTDEQAAKLEEGLAHMKGALERVGRFDWRNVAATTLVTKGVEIGVRSWPKSWPPPQLIYSEPGEQRSTSYRPSTPSSAPRRP